MMNKSIFLAGLLFFSGQLFSQQLRLSDHNTIGWFAYTGSIKVNPKLAVHTEFQWRRTETVRNGQQNLVRTGLRYSINGNVDLTLGYAFAGTFSYGDYPAAFAFPEHRAFEMLTVKNPLGKIDFSHRFILEQRFVGSVTKTGATKNTAYNYLNRMRYRVRAELPLSGKNKWSLIVQDEVFIGWGKNIGANVFDQNRIGLFAGCRISPLLKLEAGYINQVLQQPKQVNNRSVFQYNNGFVLSANFNIDLTK